MDLMNYIDVSSSILFEATADSEADSDFNRNLDTVTLSAEHSGVLADDDALSCSYDNTDLNDFDQYPTTTTTTDHRQFDLIDSDADRVNLYENDGEEEEEEEEDEDEEEEEGVVNQFRNGDNNNNNNKGKDLKNSTTYRIRRRRSLGNNYSRRILMEKKQRRRKKLKICAEEFMNQREKDKLFWETCLAS